MLLETCFPKNIHQFANADYKKSRYHNLCIGIFQISVARGYVVRGAQLCAEGRGLESSLDRSATDK